MAEYTLSQRIKVGIIGMIGSAIEDFDFIAAGVIASIAWPYVFFPKISPIAGLIASISAYLVSYVARPIGGYLFGNYGDKFGRKSGLIWTLLTVGVGVLIIAILPGYTVLGLLAPIILFIARIIQGLGFGGEWGNATTWLIEIARDSKWRAIWASLVPEGYAIGGLSATALINFLIASEGFKNFVDFYWRVPFYVGLIMIILGVIIRYIAMESPIFAKLIEENKILKSPASLVLRTRFKEVMLLAGVNMTAQLPFFIAITVMLSYMTLVLKISSKFVTFTTVIGEIAGLFLVIISALLADIYGRKKILLLLFIIDLIFVYPYILLINTSNLALILLAQVILMGLTFAAVSSISAFIPETFEKEYRASGSNLAYQIGILVGVLPQSLIIAYLIGLGKTGSLYIATVIFITVLLSIISLIFTNETKDKDV
jgi:MFS family permease